MGTLKMAAKREKSIKNSVFNGFEFILVSHSLGFTSNIEFNIFQKGEQPSEEGGPFAALFILHYRVKSACSRVNGS